MAIKKSELYSSLWKSCDELRGSMDASQYKDYVLVLLFMKYVSDKGGDLVDIPKGGSFEDMKKLKGQSDIGDKINKIIGELAKANDLNGVITVADFNDDEKLGKGKDKVDRLSNLIEIFENEALDFSGNRAENDDILGDAYEYLMRHFATESGKSKGQFYTPAEVSRIMAKVISIDKSKSQSDTVYDPTCGSGSLLLKAANESPHGISIYGQENDNATRALAVMNMWLHGNPDSAIEQGNTLAAPEPKDDKTGLLKTYDYAVANPPFSSKNWSNGVDAENDIYRRFEGFGIPPNKNGDYAFLLHFIKSLKSKGKGAIILPLGVLFRGNAEAGIRKSIIDRGYIKGIIGLPANLFYGTGIAASIIIIDKEDAEHRKGIFMIDAGKGFIKDGNKNRLREQDIHQVVDVFNKQQLIPKYSRMVPLSEIKGSKNDYNLNIPRYIDSQEKEDLQNIEAHLKGGIPKQDIDDLSKYWKVYPTLKTNLFKPNDRPDFWDLNIEKNEIKSAIFDHPEFISFSKEMGRVFAKWQRKNTAYLKGLDDACLPKEVIQKISEDLLKTFQGKDLIDKYDVYQHMTDYWAETMQDDLYELAADGWKAGNVVTRLIKKAKKKDQKDKDIAGIEGLEGQLIPPSLIIQEYFEIEQTTVNDLQSRLDAVAAEMEELREEHCGDEGLLTDAMNDKGKISKATLKKRQVEVGKRSSENAEEFDLLKSYEKLMTKETKLKADTKKALAELEIKIINQYPKLNIDEIKTLVVDKKWMANIGSKIITEMDAISHRLTERIKELAERYETPMPKLTHDVTELTYKVEDHLKDMGYAW
jgi:type I restriction enzyme M protein